MAHFASYTFFRTQKPVPNIARLVGFVYPLRQRLPVITSGCPSFRSECIVVTDLHVIFMLKMPKKKKSQFLSDTKKADVWKTLQPSDKGFMELGEKTTPTYKVSECEGFVMSNSYSLTPSVSTSALNTLPYTCIPIFGNLFGNLHRSATCFPAVVHGNRGTTPGTLI